MVKLSQAGSNGIKGLRFGKFGLVVGRGGKMKREIKGELILLAEVCRGW
jgi:hypothetical protein